MSWLGLTDTCPKPMPRKMTKQEQVQRFWSLVKVGNATECWPWTGDATKASVQYGLVYFDGKLRSTHRVAWMVTYGEIPEIPNSGHHGTCVLHKCDFGLCCNPTHLFLGTNQDNMDDRRAKRRHGSLKVTHCPHGHEYTPSNVFLWKGARQCRECGRKRCRERRRRKMGTKPENYRVL